MRILFYLTVAAAVLFSTEAAFGQMNRKDIIRNNRRVTSYRGKKLHFGKERNYNTLGVSLNALNYFGDLAPRPSKISTDLIFTRPALGLSFSHRFGPRYSVVANFMYGTLKGADAESAQKDDANAKSRYIRNLSFRNRIKELSVVGVFDLFENADTYNSRVRWTPYAFLGVAVLHHNPQAIVPKTGVDGQPMANSGEWVKLRPLGTEGQYSTLLATDGNYGIKPYNLIQAAIPFGLGVRFRLNQVMDFSFEMGFRYLFTDYIDDVSENYVDLGIFGTNELAKAMSYRSFELPEYAPGATNTNLTSYVGRDGKQYFVVPGYGQEFTNADGESNIRGNSGDRDIFAVTTFKLTYILGKTFHRSKFR